MLTFPLPLPGQDEHPGIVCKTTSISANRPFPSKYPPWCSEIPDSYRFDCKGISFLIMVSLCLCFSQGVTDTRESIFAVVVLTPPLLLLHKQFYVIDCMLALKDKAHENLISSHSVSAFI